MVSAGATRRGQQPPPLPSSNGPGPHGSPRLAACDFCGNKLGARERPRVVWRPAPAVELVLAEICEHCAKAFPSLLVRYGGLGRNRLGLAEQRIAGRPRARTRGAVLATARGAAYLLVAVACFALVTLMSSVGR